MLKLEYEKNYNTLNLYYNYSLISKALQFDATG